LWYTIVKYLPYFTLTKRQVRSDDGGVLVSYLVEFGPYYKRKLELKSNSSEILPVNCMFICYSTIT